MTSLAKSSQLVSETNNSIFVTFDCLIMNNKFTSFFFLSMTALRKHRKWALLAAAFALCVLYTFGPHEDSDLKIEIPLPHLRHSWSGNFTIVTQVSSDQFERLLNMLGSVHHWSPQAKVIVYAMKLSISETLLLSCFRDVEVRVGRENLQPLLLVNQTLSEHEMVLYVDPDIEFRSPVDGIVDIIAKTGCFFVSTNTLLSNVPWLRINASTAGVYGASTLSQQIAHHKIFGFRRGSTAARDIVHTVLASRVGSLPVSLALSIHHHGYVIQDHFHFLLEEKSLFFGANPRYADQRQTFVMRHQHSLFPFREAAAVDKDACLGPSEASAIASEASAIASEASAIASEISDQDA
jgi:hypothetical protein